VLANVMVEMVSQYCLPSNISDKMCISSVVSGF